MKKILSIDVGILNLGYVYCYISDYGISVEDCNKIDITIMRHSRVPFCDCKIQHDNCFPDYLEHFFQEYINMFNDADIILVERQPITGITNVQDLILNKFRNKVNLVSPNKIHKYFNMSKDYNKRKIQSQSIAEKYLFSNTNYINLIRKHDISDAMLLVIHYYSTNYLNNNNNNENKQNIIDLEQFRFNIK